MHSITRTMTKIVATVGPASQSPEMLEALIGAGVDILRLNFSHGTQTDHATVIAAARSVAADLNRPVALLQDLQGPKLRVGDLAGGGPIHLEPGATIRIGATGPNTRPGTAEEISTTYSYLAEDLEVGDRILLDDGALELRVEATEPALSGPGYVTCRVVFGGLLRERKGVNLPGANLRVPALTEKDEADLAFGIEHGVDLIALSFVRSADDLRRARSMIRKLGGRQPLIAKIEKPQAVKALESIIRASDGIMVARGDLGVELSPEAVPAIQKRAIRLANRHGVPVITATQMLESMMTNPRPTRAEASDVANAILDGSDAVMLSGETAVGAHPIAAVAVMNKIAVETEQSIAQGSVGPRKRTVVDLAPAAARSDAHAIARAANALARALPAKAIVVLTATGRTAGIVSGERPGTPIIALTHDGSVARRLALWYGVLPVVVDRQPSLAQPEEIERLVVERGLAEPGDHVVVLGSTPRSARRRSVTLQVLRLASSPE
jgi:pyruvate kinase